MQVYIYPRENNLYVSLLFVVKSHKRFTRYNGSQAPYPINEVLLERLQELSTRSPEYMGCVLQTDNTFCFM